MCVKIIRSKEITATEKDTLIIRKVRFDPHKARELGVPSQDLPTSSWQQARRHGSMAGSLNLPWFLPAVKLRSTSRGWRSIHEVNC